MSESVLEQSLQFASQETAVVLGVAALVGALVVALVGRRRYGPVSSGRGGSSPTGEPMSDGGTTVVPQETERSGPEGSEERDDATASPDPEELDNRLDDLEGDVEALSTAVKAVHSENEQISETVQDVEENTGRLLNLYEMATRGVNPFAGGPESASGSASGNSGTVEEETETIDTDVADPDAEALFTGSDGDGPEIRDEHCVDSVEEVVETETEPADAFQRRKQSERADGSDGVEEIASEDEGSETEGTDPLDDELEPETVEEWFGETNEPAEAHPENLGTEETIEAPSGSNGTAASDGGVLIEDDGPATPAEPDVVTESPEETETADVTQETEAASPAPVTETESPGPGTETTVSAQEPDGLPMPDESGEVPSESGTPATPGGHAATEGKPYIESLPDGFGAEVITVEWLEYLIDEVGLHETVRAIHYYETIDWLTEEAAAELDAYLDGFDGGEGGSLSVDHHLRSLDYVEELTATGEGAEGSE